MTNKVKKEVEAIIKKYNLDYSVEEFRNQADWKYISVMVNFSEDFIREFKNKVNWISICCHQILSEDFIIEFKNKIDWSCIVAIQKFSENFIYNMKDVMGKKNFNYCLKKGKITQKYIEKRKIPVNRFELMDLND